MDDESIDAVRQEVRRLIARLRHPSGRTSDLGTVAALDAAHDRLVEALGSLTLAYHRQPARDRADVHADAR